MKRGLLYLAFGEEYDKLAAHTIAYSRQFTDLPICVLTNLEKRHSKWEAVENVDFIYIPLSRDDNRDIKTSMIKYTPFDLSLFLDCDSVIQKEGVEKVFDLVEGNDLLLQRCLYWRKGAKVVRLYKKMMLQVNVQLPIAVYHSCCIGFRKNEQMIGFFNLWNTYWKLSGRGRDMPALACTIKNSSVRLKNISNREEIFSETCDNNVIVQHEYGSGFHTVFGIPEFKEWKPFDIKHKEDLEFVDFE